jgi:hypothetical protein
MDPRERYDSMIHLGKSNPSRAWESWDWPERLSEAHPVPEIKSKRETETEQNILAGASRRPSNKQYGIVLLLGGQFSSTTRLMNPSSLNSKPSFAAGPLDSRAKSFMNVGNINASRRAKERGQAERVRDLTGQDPISPSQVAKIDLKTHARSHSGRAHFARRWVDSVLI